MSNPFDNFSSNPQQHPRKNNLPPVSIPIYNGTQQRVLSGGGMQSNGQSSGGSYSSNQNVQSGGQYYQQSYPPPFQQTNVYQQQYNPYYQPQLSPSYQHGVSVVNHNQLISPFPNNVPNNTPNLQVYMNPFDTRPISQSVPNISMNKNNSNTKVDDDNWDFTPNQSTSPNNIKSPKSDSVQAFNDLNIKNNDLQDLLDLPITSNITPNKTNIKSSISPLDPPPQPRTTSRSVSDRKKTFDGVSPESRKKSPLPAFEVPPSVTRPSIEQKPIISRRSSLEKIPIVDNSFDTNNDDSHFFQDDRKFSATKNILVLDDSIVAHNESKLSPKRDKNINSKVINVKSADACSSSESDNENDGKKKHKKKGKFNTLTYLRNGCAFLKYGRSGYPHFRYFFLSENNSSIIWYSTGKDLEETTIQIGDIQKISSGLNAGVFVKSIVSSNLSEYAFTIDYCGEKSGKRVERTLDVITTSKFYRDIWIKTIKRLMKLPYDERVNLNEYFISPSFDITVPSNQNETESAFQESVHYGIFHTLGLAKGLVIENSRANVEKLLDATLKNNNKVRDSLTYKNNLYTKLTSHISKVHEKLALAHTLLSDNKVESASLYVYAMSYEIEALSQAVNHSALNSRR